MSKMTRWLIVGLMLVALEVCFWSAAQCEAQTTTHYVPHTYSTHTAIANLGVNGKYVVVTRTNTNTGEVRLKKIKVHSLQDDLSSSGHCLYLPE